MKENNILIFFGNKVREMRRLKGYSQEELADKANLHRTYIGMIERGEKNITLLSIQKIAIALNIEIFELLNNLDNQNDTFCKQSVE